MSVMLLVNPLTLTTLFIPDRSGSLCVKRCHHDFKKELRLPACVDVRRFHNVKGSSIPADAVRSRITIFPRMGHQVFLWKKTNNSRNSPATLTQPIRLITN